jgi:hypothetical protein
MIIENIRPVWSRKILFREENEIVQPFTFEEVKCCVDNFGKGYNNAARDVIKNSDDLIEDTFTHNAARILNNFGMARSGPFQGVKPSMGKGYEDPSGNLKKCWEETKTDLRTVKDMINHAGCFPRSRTLILLNKKDRAEIVNLIWQIFKKLLPITIGKTSSGLVGASKLLFSVFPEIVLPIDNAEWRRLFQTVDLGDVINGMADEIQDWEEATSLQLENCDTGTPQLTLPGVFNVMAMKARPKDPPSQP